LPGAITGLMVGVLVTLFQFSAEWIQIYFFTWRSACFLLLKFLFLDL